MMPIPAFHCFAGDDSPSFISFIGGREQAQPGQLRLPPEQPTIAIHYSKFIFQNIVKSLANAELDQTNFTVALGRHNKVCAVLREHMRHARSLSARFPKQASCYLTCFGFLKAMHTICVALLDED